MIRFTPWTEGGGINSLFYVDSFKIGLSRRNALVESCRFVRCNDESYVHVGPFQFMF